MKKVTVEDPACPKRGAEGGKGDGGKSNVPVKGREGEKGNGGKSNVPKKGERM